MALTNRSRTGKESELGKVRQGYYRNGEFYPDQSGSTPISGNHDPLSIYIDLSTDAMYRYNSTLSAYVMIGPPSLRVVWED